MISASPARTAVLLASGLVAVTLSAAPTSAEHTTYTLDVRPEMERNPIGGLHVLTATVTPASALPQLEVHFEITSGPNAEQKSEIFPDVAVFSEPDDTCVVPAGQTTCKITIRDTRAPTGGTTDTIVAWVDHDQTIAVDAENLDLDEHHDAGEPPHEPGAPTGSEGNTPEPDSTDVVIKHWGQLQVGSIPFIDGFLEPAGDERCSDSRERLNGRVVGVGNSCARMFAVDPGTEENPERDYYVSWVQSSGRTKGAWCATRFALKARGPRESKAVGFATTPQGRIRNPKEALTTEMLIDSAGFAFAPSYLRNDYFLAKGKVRVTSRTRNVTTVWRGSTGKKLVIVTAWAFSVPAGSGTPNPGDPSDTMLQLEGGNC